MLDAERWGDEVFQAVPRRLIDAAFLRSPISIESYAGDAKLPLPRSWMRPALGLTARAMALKNGASDPAARADLMALPGMLDRVDAFVADGVLGGTQPTAADLQIGATIRLLASIGDVAPLIAGRPSERLAGLFGVLAGNVPPGRSRPSGWRRSPAPGRAPRAPRRPHVERSVPAMSTRRRRAREKRLPARESAVLSAGRREI